MRATRQAKAPAGTGATQEYFDRHHHSRRRRAAQQGRSLHDLVEAATARRQVRSEDREPIVENATAFAEAVEVRAESMVPRRVRRCAQWAQAQALAAALAVDLEIARGQNLEQYPVPLASYPVAVENQSRDLVRHLLDNLDLDNLDGLVVQLAAVLVVLVVSVTFTTTPATCRGSARRRRRRRGAATCSRARAARKGAGRDARPHAPSRMG